MPRFRKLNSAEIAALEQRPPGTRAQIAREYDAYVADFAVGDYGRVELAAHEQRKVVRGRLHAAARRHGLVLRFRPGSSKALIFRVEAAPPVARPAPPSAAGADERRGGPARRDGEPSRPPRRRQTATERYHEVLPRWMREGRQIGHRDGRKRRTR